LGTDCHFLGLSITSGGTFAWPNGATTGHFPDYLVGFGDGVVDIRPPTRALSYTARICLASTCWGHMLLSMAVPLLLVLGAPITLASRAIVARKDGSRGAREWILVAVHSKYLAIIGHPVVAASIFGLSLIVFYYSPLFEWALKDHLGHLWMTAHFVFSGYLFAQSLIGIDPSPHNPPYPLRLIIVLATMAFHAFFGLSIILGTSLLVPDWYGAMGRTWGIRR